MLKAYKFLIKPTKEQSEMFEKHFGAARFVYNWNSPNQRLWRRKLWLEITKLSSAKQEASPLVGEVVH
jgi:transposase